MRPTRIIPAVLIVFLLFGCSGNNRRLAGDAHGAVFERANGKAEDAAQRIADIVKQNTEIEHSSVVISGSTAIVAINLKRELSDKELITLKTRIKEQALAAEKSVSHVAVSSAPELYEKLQGKETALDKAEEDELHRSFDGDGVLFRLNPTY